MSDALEPFQLFELTNGKYNLILSDFEPACDVFEDAGHGGYGYGWEAVAMHLLENDAADLGDLIELDSESSMFCAYGTDRNALYALSVRLARLFRDHRSLRKMIEVIGSRGFEV